MGKLKDFKDKEITLRTFLRLADFYDISLDDILERINKKDVQDESMKQLLEYTNQIALMDQDVIMKKIKEYQDNQSGNETNPEI